MVSKIVIHGAAGRMGQRLIALAWQDPQFEVVAALENGAHPALGQDAGQVAGVGTMEIALSSDWTGDGDAVVDFSSPKGADQIIGQCIRHRKPLVLATTALESATQARVNELAAEVPVVQAPNMSLAVNMAMGLASRAARMLKDHPGGADVEVIERHHRFKVDAPSGTALRFGQLIADAMGIDNHVHGRHGLTGARPHDEIGYHALRTGDNPGEHTIVFGLLGETMELTVRATSRDAYAVGALAAARFMIGKPPGVYSMFNVLGLD